MVGDDSLRTWRDGPTVDRRLDFSDCGTLLEVHEQIRKEPGAAAVVRAEPGCAVGQPDRDHGDPGGRDDRVQAAKKLRPDILEIVEVFQEAQDQAGVLTLHVEM